LARSDRDRHDRTKCRRKDPRAPNGGVHGNGI
jgi:hypothetical protein